MAFVVVRRWHLSIHSVFSESPSHLHMEVVDKSVWSTNHVPAPILHSRLATPERSMKQRTHHVEPHLHGRRPCTPRTRSSGPPCRTLGAAGDGLILGLPLWVPGPSKNRSPHAATMSASTRSEESNFGAVRAKTITIMVGPGFAV